MIERAIMTLFKFKKLNLEDRGLGRVLGPLERRILEYLWTAGEANARVICDELCKKGEISFNAVNTVLGRLVEKGILARRKVASHFAYSPKTKREEFMQLVSRRVLGSLLKDKELFSPHALFAAMEELTPPERKRMRELIKKAHRITTP